MSEEKIGREVISFTDFRNNQKKFFDELDSGEQLLLGRKGCIYSIIKMEKYDPSPIKQEEICEKFIGEEEVTKGMMPIEAYVISNNGNPIIVTDDKGNDDCIYFNLNTKRIVQVEDLGKYSEYDSVKKVVLGDAFLSSEFLSEFEDKIYQGFLVTKVEIYRVIDYKEEEVRKCFPYLMKDGKLVLTIKEISPIR